MSTATTSADTTGTAIVGKSAIDLYRLAALRSMLKMEKAGLKNSSGPIRPRIADELGLKPRAPHDTYITKLTDMIAAGEKALAQGAQS